MSEIVLVCGGRDYEDYRKVRTTLDAFHAERGIELLVEGHSGHYINRHSVPGEIWTPRVLKRVQGADLLAEEWAIYNRVPFWPYEITQEEWNTLGRKAGPLRNKRMLVERRPAVCIAFPGGRGTADMVRQARDAGVEVIEVPA